MSLLSQIILLVLVGCGGTCPLCSQALKLRPSSETRRVHFASPLEHVELIESVKYYDKEALGVRILPSPEGKTAKIVGKYSLDHHLKITIIPATTKDEDELPADVVRNTTLLLPRSRIANSDVTSPNTTNSDVNNPIPPPPLRQYSMTVELVPNLPRPQKRGATKRLELLHAPQNCDGAKVNLGADPTTSKWRFWLFVVRPTQECLQHFPSERTSLFPWDPLQRKKPSHSQEEEEEAKTTALFQIVVVFG